MSGLRPTEMTIRDLLQEELRRRGVTVVPEFSVQTPVGRKTKINRGLCKSSLSYSPRQEFRMHQFFKPNSAFRSFFNCSKFS